MFDSLDLALVSVVLNIILAIGLVVVWKSRNGWVSEFENQKEVSAFWKRSSDRKEVDLFALNREINLLRDWIKKKWGGE